MALKQNIQKELMTAMKEGNELKVSVLRMLKASILKFEVEGERKEATDENVLQLINREIKQRRDSAEQFRSGNRPEQAEKEEKEIEFLLEYLPPQLGEDQIVAIVKTAIEETGASAKSDMGKVMGAIMPKLKGQADGAIVNRVVNSLLN